MAGTIFFNTLRRSWRQILYWGGGIAILGFVVMLVLNDIDVLEQYAEIAASLPPVILQAFGAQDASSLATAEGYIAFGVFTYGAFIIAAFGVVAGVNITASEEEAGILDVVLSLPVPRWRIIFERYAAYAVITVGIAALTFVGLWIGSIFSELKPDMLNTLAACLNLVPFTLLIIAITAFLGTVLRRRAAVTAVAAGVVIVSYLIDFLGNAASGTILASLRPLSFFSYYESESTMMSGIIWSNLLVLTVAALALVALALWFFDRRDIGV